MLIVLKGLPSGYSKDLQEDKEAIFDAYESIDIILKIANEIIKLIKINKKEMLNLPMRDILQQLILQIGWLKILIKHSERHIRFQEK